MLTPLGFHGGPFKQRDAERCGGASLLGYDRMGLAEALSRRRAAEPPHPSSAVSPSLREDAMPVLGCPPFGNCDGTTRTALAGWLVEWHSLSWSPEKP